MRNIATIICKHDRFYFVSIEIDGIKYRGQRKGDSVIMDIPLTDGIHHVSIRQKNILDTWFWWITVFNILYAGLSIKFKNKWIGYDGNHTDISFDLDVQKGKEKAIILELVNNEVNRDYLDGYYNEFEFYNDANVKNIKKNTLSNHKYKRRWRYMQIAPYVLLLLLYMCFPLFVEDTSELGGIVGFVGLSLYVTVKWIMTFMKKSVKEEIANAKKSKKNNHVSRT